MPDEDAWLRQLDRVFQTGKSASFTGQELGEIPLRPLVLCDVAGDGG